MRLTPEYLHGLANSTMTGHSFIRQSSVTGTCELRHTRRKTILTHTLTSRNAQKLLSPVTTNSHDRSTSNETVFSRPIWDTCRQLFINRRTDKQVRECNVRESKRREKIGFSRFIHFQTSNSFFSTDVCLTLNVRCWFYGIYIYAFQMTVMKSSAAAPSVCKLLNWTAVSK